MDNRTEQFNHIVQATTAVQNGCARKPMTFMSVDRIAKQHNVPTHQLLANLSLIGGYEVDYGMAEVRCLTKSATRRSS